MIPGGHRASEKATKSGTGTDKSKVSRFSGTDLQDIQKMPNIMCAYAHFTPGVFIHGCYNYEGKSNTRLSAKIPLILIIRTGEKRFNYREEFPLASSSLVSRLTSRYAPLRIVSSTKVRPVWMGGESESGLGLRGVHVEPARGGGGGRHKQTYGRLKVTHLASILTS